MKKANSLRQPNQKVEFFSREKGIHIIPFFKGTEGYLFFTLLELIIVIAVIAILVWAISSYSSSAKCGAYKNALTAAANNCRQAVSMGTPQSIEDCLASAIKELRKVKQDTSCLDKATRASLAGKLKEIRDQAINRKTSAEPTDTTQWARIIAKLDSIKIIGKLP